MFSVLDKEFSLCFQCYTRSFHCIFSVIHFHCVFRVRQGVFIVFSVLDKEFSLCLQC